MRELPRLHVGGGALCARRLSEARARASVRVWTGREHGHDADTQGMMSTAATSVWTDGAQRRPRIIAANGLRVEGGGRGSASAIGYHMETEPWESSRYGTGMHECGRCSGKGGRDGERRNEEERRRTRLILWKPYMLSCRTKLENCEGRGSQDPRRDGSTQYEED